MINRVLSLLLFALTLSACGGGGGASGSPPVSSNQSPVLSNIGSPSILEGGIAVTSVSASDPEGDTLNFSLSGSDAAAFSLNESGDLTFTSARDFESPGDANGDNAYNVTVSVSDGSLSDTESIIVTVINALEGRVVDGPVSGAKVTRSGSDDEATTDDDGYYLLGPAADAADQQLTSVGGTDTVTGKALPDLVLIGDIPSDPANSISINAITTVVASVDHPDDKQQVLDALGVALTPYELSLLAIWNEAQAGDVLAQSAQRKNAQLNVLLSTTQSVASAIGSSDVVMVVTEAAKRIAEIASSSDEPIDLADSGVIKAVITDTVQAVLPDADISEDLVSAVVGAVADTNTVAGDEGIDPTSDTARGVTSAAQDELQSSVDGVASGLMDIESFEESISTNTLFSDVPTDPEAPDTDDDGQPDVLDADDDADGVRDGDDAFPLDASETIDTDGDGVGNNADTDDDNDGAADGDDAFPLDPSESADTDGDGVGNNADADDDGDGVADADDAFPLDASETIDTDGDGVGNNADTDDDGDGVADISDAFPLDPSEAVDTDGDGIGNNADADDDGDGVADSGDAFPLDASETIDTDGDGVGNNADTDDDGDGVLDTEDVYPTDSRYQFDSDHDGMPDNWETSFALNPLSNLDRDTDADSDGLPNIAEFTYGTNPRLRDSDRDTLSDGFEFWNGGDPLAPRYELAVRSAHGCVTSDDGIQCWGESGNGRTTPPAVINPRGVGVGLQHSCTISQGDVVCWGGNYNGEQNVPIMGVVDYLAVGEQSACAHSSISSETKCWGWNGNGEAEPPNLINPTQIDAGPQHYCAIDDEGVKCWGWNGNLEAQPPALDAPTDVEAGRWSSCAIDLGQVKCWGLQANYFLPPTLNEPFDVAVGAWHTCAIDSDGVHCWGSTATPPDLTNPVQIEAGDYYTCALHDGGIACWGDLPSSSLMPPDSLFFDADGDSFSSQGFKDVFPEDASEWIDTDSDGVGNNEDPDDDGDGVADADDAFPLDGSETVDSDGDGVGDNGDTDDDNDGVVDIDDAFPRDPTESLDTDGDGVGNNADQDDDNDGVDDVDDSFPVDHAAAVDSDGDGYPDYWNSDASQADIGSSDLQIDQMPNDPLEHLDTDEDGIGNNADTDDDGDGVSDDEDVAPLDASVAGFFVSGRVTIDGEITLDSDTNNPSNPFFKNNVDGNYDPNTEIAQEIDNPASVHGYVNKPGAGLPGTTFESGDEDDFFVVNALAGQRFNLSIGDYQQGDLDFYLWNEDLQIVASSEGIGPQETITVPEDGTYYLNVYAWSGASNYIVDSEFTNLSSSSSPLRFGEVIVTLKSANAESVEVLREKVTDLAERYGVTIQSKGTASIQLLKSTSDSKQLMHTLSHPKLKSLTSAELVNNSLTSHLVKLLQADPNVQTAQPNYMYFPTATTNDPLLADMWHLDQIKVARAWDVTFGDPGVIVAVIDSGVLKEHPELSENSSSGYDFISWPENSDGDGIDPDPEDAMPPIDRCDGGTFYHGAHVAGTVAAAGNNGEGIAGVAFDVSLMHLRALDGGCGGSTYDIAQAVRYAIGVENDSGHVPDNPADIINMSLGGGPQDDYMQRTLSEAASRGIILVGSSGNSGNSSVSFPARYDSVLAVGATNREGQVTGYSNKGPNLALVAPGGGMSGGVWSLHKDEMGYSYTQGQGTSMAAPHAAGVFALMKSVHPNLNHQRLKTYLEFELITDNIGISGFDAESGWGLINADKALDVAMADADGSLRLPARIVLSSSQIYLGENLTDVDITVTNPGELALEVTQVEVESLLPPVTSAWLEVTENHETDATDTPGFVGNWRFVVDRAGLPTGFHVATIVFSAIDEEGQQLSRSLKLILKVAKDATGGNVGLVNVQLINSDNNETLWSTASTASDAYEFRLGVTEGGDYRIEVSSDVDNGGFICGVGDFCGALEATLLTPRSDLNIAIDGPR